jgi:hypothetical protein
MPRRIVLTLLGSLFCCPFLQGVADVDLDQIKELARAYFRDSTEIPMNVAVTTTVTDAAGKVKHQGQATVGMVFNGYHQESGKFSFRANSGMLNAGAMRDSVSGDLAAFFAGGMIPKKDPSLIEIRQSPEPGKPVLVVVKDKECPALELMQRAMFPQHPCGLARYRCFSISVSIVREVRRRRRSGTWATCKCWPFTPKWSFRTWFCRATRSRTFGLWKR